MKYVIKRSPKTPWWNLHSHSRYSANDALPEVETMVDTVAAMQQPALGLTDHGNMAGSVQLYTHCQRAGIKPFPGSELYVVHDRGDKKAKRRHMCVVAYTTEGYANLVNLSSLTHKNFYHKPLVDYRDFAELHEAGRLRGLAATSGCYFGVTVQALLSEGETAALQLMKSFDTWFDKFYVELQSHNIEHDGDVTDQAIIDQLLGLADQIGLPCVITQDAHYAHQGDKEDHDTLKRLVSYGSERDDGVFPGDGFHLADERWILAHHTDAALRAGLDGLGELLELHTLRIRELDSYTYNVPFTVADPETDLRTYCEQRIRDLGLPDPYVRLLGEELEVIEYSRMAGYLLLVKEITDWCREEKIFTQARGSASGSLVCWLLGITQADPILWGLRYDRFISRDRTKPPDIDLDVEHTKRGRLIEWLSSRFATSHIGTYTTYSLGEDNHEKEAKRGKGSLRIKYYARKRATGAELLPWQNVPEQDKQALLRLSDRGLISNYGVHPAGFVLTSTQSDLDALVPMQYVASSSVLTTQYNGKDVEALGMVKLDILGLKTLTVLNKASANLGVEDLDWIPMGDKLTFRSITNGNTTGVFQLEGGSARRGVQNLVVTKISDIIAAMALFRPAAMNTGATDRFIERKNKREKIPDRHPIIMKATAETYGIMLYQEQVIAILRAVGMEPDPLTEFLNAVKSSNRHIGKAAEVIDSAKGDIHQLCLASGMTDDEFTELWHDIEGFAEYGFNKAHSTAYGIAAYKCAYLATHHPLEFYAALLNVAAGNKDKEPVYLRAARSKGIKVRPPHVNGSGVSYEVDQANQCIRKGLLSLDGVGEKAAESIISARPPGGFASREEFCELVNHRKVTGIKAYLTEKDTTVGTFGVLESHRAFEGL